MEYFWIAAGNNSPAPGDGVLLCVDGRVIYGWRRPNPGRGHYHYQGVHGVVRGVVTHWMPLPQAPK